MYVLVGVYAFTLTSSMVPFFQLQLAVPSSASVCSPHVHFTSKFHEILGCDGIYKPGIHISVGDGLSESAQEILGAFVQNDIRHVVVMGMAANMCLLVRPFGLRLLSRFAQRESAGEKEARDGPGKLPRWQVVVARDLTDIMYDPRNPPYLTHAKAKALVLRHIERYICASIHSSHLFPPPP